MLAEKQLNIAREAVHRTGDATQMAGGILHAARCVLPAWAQGCPCVRTVCSDADVAELRSRKITRRVNRTAVDVHLLLKM